MENIYRNKYCGEITKEDNGQVVKIAGWINSIRNLGSLCFLTIRDETGIVQVITLVVSKVVFKENLTWQAIIGASLVIIGVLIMNWKRD